MYRLLIKRSCNGLKNNTTSKLINRNLITNPRTQFREAGFGKFLIILSPLAVGGGVVAYAKYDKEFRKTLTTNVPAAEPVLEVLLDDANPFADIQKKLNEYSDSIKGLFSSNEEAKSRDPPKPFVTTTTSLPKSPYTKSPASATKTTSVPAPEITPPKVSQPKTEVAPIEKTTIVPASRQIEIGEIEKGVEEASMRAIKEYNKAVQILKNYNDDVRKIVDSAVENIDVNAWTSLKNKTLTRDNALEAAEKSALEARMRLHELENKLEKNAANISNDERVSILRNIQSFNDHLNAAKLEVLKAKELAGTTENYWKKVEAARNFFVNEIESLFSVNLNDKKLNLSKEDVDLFLLNAYSHVSAYQKELNKLETEGELRLKRAVDAVRGSDHTEAVNAQLEYELEKERRKLNLENQSKIIRIKAETERRLHEQLKKQIEAHTDHLNDAISQKELELKRKFSRELDEKVSSERANYVSQLALMLGKLKGMDSALKDRVDAEKSAHQAQSLWSACQTLWSSVRSGQPGKSWRDQLRPLNSEIEAVKTVAEGDELVAVVLNTLPDTARERGVFPEEALRERFVNVDKVARRLALVPIEGASLPVYLLSFIQGALIAKPSEVISKDELENKDFDFSKLDTYEILNRARYWLDRGNLVQTLKYMNLLKGAPRKVSNEWLSEARLLLETQQAVNVLMAHAAANGVRYL